MAKYEAPTGLSIQQLGLTLEELRASSLDEQAQRGAKLILETALREEVLDFLGRDRYERSGEDALPGYLNGHRQYCPACLSSRVSMFRSCNDTFSV